jgi:hypothetical protein
LAVDVFVTPTRSSGADETGRVGSGETLCAASLGTMRNINPVLGELWCAAARAPDDLSGQR